MQNKEFEHILSDRFEAHGSVPSDGVWAGIEGNLDKRKRRLIIFWWTSAASILAFLLFWGISLNKANARKQHNFAGKTSPAPLKQNTSNKNVSIESKDKKVIQIDQDRDGTTPSARQYSAAMNIKENSLIKLYPVIKSTSHSANITARNDNNLSPILPLEYIQIDQLETNHSYDIQDVLAVELSNEDTTISMNVGCRLILPLWEVGGTISTFSKLSKTTMAEWLPPTSTYQNLSDPATSFSIPFTRVHRRTLELEAIVRRHLQGRWQLGSGINAAYSTDDVSYSSESSLRSQTWSLGIPLHLRYLLMNRGRYKLKGDLGVYNEFLFFQSQATPPSSTNGLTLQNVSEFTGTDKTGYNLSIQPSIEFDFYLNSKWFISANFGYRGYVVKQPPFGFIENDINHYLNFTLGAFWSF